MAKKQIPYPLYDLTGSQSTMYTMLRYSIHKNVNQIPTSIVCSFPLDFDLLKRALNEEFRRNDCLRIRLYKDGDTVKQYFLPEYRKDDVPVLTFSTREEQEATLDKLSQQSLRVFKGEMFRIAFYNTYDGRKGIFFNTTHIINDAAGVAFFYLDLLQVYKAMAEGSEMPKPPYSYEEQVQKELKNLADKEKMAKAAEFYKNFFLKDGEPFYAGVHGHDMLDKAREKDPTVRVPAAYDAFNDKSRLIHREMSLEDSEKIFDFCRNNEVSPETLLEAGYRAFVSKRNYRTEDTLSLQMCSRRMTFKEKYMGGCLAQPLHVRCIIPQDYTFRQSLDTLNNVRNTLYKYLYFPYLYALNIEMKLFNWKIVQGPNFMMFSWLPMLAAGGEEMKKMGIEFQGLNLGRYVMPLYTFCYPNTTTGALRFQYLYRVNRLTEADIDLMHENMTKAVLAGIDNPDITIREIMDDVMVNVPE